MIVWMIWLQGDGATWLHSAWDDDSTAGNHTEYQEDVEKAHKIALEDGYEVRIQKVHVPGVSALFEIPEVVAEPR